MATPTEVRLALAEKLAVFGFKNVHPYEPENLGDLPCATLLTMRVEPRETGTGPRLDVNWIWHLRIYVGLSEWAASQQMLDELAFACLSAWRDDPTLGDLLEWWRVTDTGEPPEFSTERRWLRKSLQVSAMIEHVP